MALGAYISGIHGGWTIGSMADRLEILLNRLKSAPLDRDLSRLEPAVWKRIDRESRSDIFGGKTFQIQFAVVCGAMILGIAIAQLAGSFSMPRPLESETVVLSDDSAMAPSVRLEGGT
jgi:hypothetical protein